MTLASSLISDAFREGNLTSTGEDPTTDEAVEGLRLLNNVFRALLGNELGENFCDWQIPSLRTAPVNANYPALAGPTYPSSSVYLYPPPNVRLLVKITSATTVYFPAHPSDGARMAYAGLGSTATLTLNGNGYIIESAATKTILSADQATPLAWFFRADIGTWKLVADLAASDSSMLPAEFDDFFITALYKRLAPRHGKNPLASTEERYQSMVKKLRARYRQAPTQVSNAADVPQTHQSYDPGTGSGDLMS